MSETFNIKRGDTSPALLWELEDPTINLEGASVVFNMRRHRDNVLVIDRGAAEIVADAERPTLRYNWQAGDTAQVDMHEAEFEITYADQSVETTPNATNIVVRVVADLG